MFRRLKVRFPFTVRRPLHPGVPDRGWPSGTVVVTPASRAVAAARTLIGCELLAFATGALASSDDGGLRMGPIEAYPALELALSYDDNVFRAPFAQRASFVGVLNPALLLKAKLRRNEFALGYQAQIGRYQNARQNNYEDHEVIGNVYLDLSTRNRLNVEAGYFAGHDPIGTNRTEGATGLLEAALLQEEPDRFDIVRAAATYSYGAEGASGRLDAYGGYFSKTYQNNREVTAVFDRDETNLGGIFYWRVRPRASWLLELQGIRFDYDVANLDSTEFSAVTGVAWATTAKTTGTVKLGYQQKDLDDSAQVDFRGIAWSAGVQWAPVTYSVFSLETSRVPKERSGSGLFKVVQEAGISWSHKWRDRVTSTASFSFANEDFRGSARVDDRWHAGLRLDFKMRRWLALAIAYDYDKRDSDEEQFNFDQNTVSLLVTVGLPGSPAATLPPVGAPTGAPIAP